MKGSEGAAVPGDGSVGATDGDAETPAGAGPDTSAGGAGPVRSTEDAAAGEASGEMEEKGGTESAGGGRGFVEKDHSAADAALAAYNPFDTDHSMGCYQVARTVLCSVTLLPIRVILVAVIFLFAYVPCKLTVCCRGRYDSHTGVYIDRPISPCARLALISYLRGLVRVALFVLGYVYIPVTKPKKPSSARVVPTEDVETGRSANVVATDAKVIVANHPGSMDVLGVFMVRPGRFLGKKLFKSVPIVSTIACAIGCLFVDRSSVESKRAARDAIERIATSDDPTVPPLILFPEGTTQNGKSMIQFQAGSFRPGGSVAPVIVKLPYKRFNAAWAAIGFDKHAFRLMTQVYNRMELTVLPQYDPTDEERSDPIKYATNVRDHIAATAGFKVVDVDYKDGLRWWNTVGQFPERVRAERERQRAVTVATTQ